MDRTDRTVVTMSLESCDLHLSELQRALRDGTDWSDAIKSARQRLREYAELMAHAEAVAASLEQAKQALLDARAAVELIR